MTQRTEPAPCGAAAGLAAVTGRLRAACERAGRPADAVQLVVVSKFHGADAIAPALAAGHRRFGENRVQEGLTKWPPLREQYPDTELDLCGRLQTNKAATAVRTFDTIHAVDRPKLAGALASAMVREERRPSCLVQVDTGDEVQKGGVALAAAEGFIKECQEVYALPVSGLTCIPPAGQDPAPHFRLLRSLAAQSGVGALSMGMSADFETAVAEGATMVRIGTAVFGPRPHN